MSRTGRRKGIAIAAALPLLYLAGIAPDAPAGLTLVPEARAVVGAPRTPLSAAGVARRTTRRVVVAETSATQAAAAAAQPPAAAPPPAPAAPRPPGAPASGAIVPVLPAGCRPETQGGVEYQNCGGVYYRAAFQGSNLVYVVQ
jgi:hypothetical protein